MVTSSDLPINRSICAHFTFILTKYRLLNTIISISRPMLSCIDLCINFVKRNMRVLLPDNCDLVGYIYIEEQQ